MILSFTPCIDHITAIKSGQSPNTAFVFSTLRAPVVGLLLLCCMFAINDAAANPLARADAAFARGDYVRAVNILTPLAFGGDARAQAALGFMFEHGYGAPQVYDSAAGLYGQAAMRGNPFGQAMFGLMYDKGHGVPQDFVLAYKWLNLAAARARKRERDHFLRLRDAVASKMSPAQIAEGQRLAMAWAIGLP
jgi:TPR repeat protein